MNPLTLLQGEMRECRRCLEAGHTITPGAIFSGSSTAEVMLIGQAPGVTEVEAGRPFNAGSGRRLFQWLGDAGWEEDDFRRRHYMTAVTKCYPGKNRSGRGDRVPSKAEQAFCRPFLEQEIRAIRPRLIILVGGLAIKLLYPARAKLTDVIGTAAYFPPHVLSDSVSLDLGQAALVTRFDALRPRDGRYVVPLPHPSGASLWPNKPANQALITQATKILDDIRVAWNL